jgi:GTP cyclohydrolase FolE2
MHLTDGPGLPDLHSELPAVRIPVRSVGHVGVKRIVPIEEHSTAAMIVMNIAVGLRPDQRGAHMSRLIECIERSGPHFTVRDYIRGVFDRLVQAMPDAAAWSVDARATVILPHDGGHKPVEEICRLHGSPNTPPSLTWGAAFKVCLACPQAQAAIAFDRDDVDNVGQHPSHNQVCDLEIVVTGGTEAADGHSVPSLLAVGEGAASGPVRELHKRRGEADVVTAIHHNALFAEDALRMIAEKTRMEFPQATLITCQIVNYESIFEYPLRCAVTV